MLFVCWNDYHYCCGHFEATSLNQALLIVSNCHQHPGCICHYGRYCTGAESAVVSCERNHVQSPCRAVKYVLHEAMTAGTAKG